VEPVPSKVGEKQARADNLSTGITAALSLLHFCQGSDKLVNYNWSHRDSFMRGAMRIIRHPFGANIDVELP
jgi:hypothetical protein